VEEEAGTPESEDCILGIEHLSRDCVKEMDLMVRKATAEVGEEALVNEDPLALMESRHRISCLIRSQAIHLGRLEESLLVMGVQDTPILRLGVGILQQADTEGASILGGLIQGDTIHVNEVLFSPPKKVRRHCYQFILLHGLNSLLARLEVDLGRPLIHLDGSDLADTTERMDGGPGMLASKGEGDHPDGLEELVTSHSQRASNGDVLEEVRQEFGIRPI
tara:strand:+ start:402 stop:1061 length:660 start_codon:yes stop_codon:yes gene_type:complete